MLLGGHILNTSGDALRGFFPSESSLTRISTLWLAIRSRVTTYIYKTFELGFISKLIVKDMVCHSLSSPRPSDFIAPISLSPRWNVITSYLICVDEKWATQFSLRMVICQVTKETTLVIANSLKYIWALSLVWHDITILHQTLLGWTGGLSICALHGSCVELCDSCFEQKQKV